MNVCKKCSKTFSSQKRLDNHLTKKIPCDFICKCSKQLANYSAFRYHTTVCEIFNENVPKNDNFFHDLYVKIIQYVKPPTFIKHTEENTKQIIKDLYKKYNAPVDNIKGIDRYNCPGPCSGDTFTIDDAYGHNNAHILSQKDCKILGLTKWDPMNIILTCYKCNFNNGTGNQLEYFSNHGIEIYPMIKKKYDLYNGVDGRPNYDNIIDFANGQLSIKDPKVYFRIHAEMISRVLTHILNI